MLLRMNEHRQHRVGDVTSRRAQLGLIPHRIGIHDRTFSISCDDCTQQCTAACDDCVVTHVLRQSDESSPTVEIDGLVLDVEEARVVRLMARAGLVPGLRFEPAG